MRGMGVLVLLKDICDEAEKLLLKSIEFRARIRNELWIGSSHALYRRFILGKEELYQIKRKLWESNPGALKTCEHFHL